MQQSQRIFVHGHARSEQIRVRAATGGADQPGVVACRKDDRGLDPAARRGAQRAQDRLVWNEVGCRDQQVLAGGIHAGDEHVGHGVVATGRAGAESLRDDAGLEPLRRRCHRRQRLELLSGLGDPGAEEQVLLLAHHRALATQEDIHPGRVLGLDPEFGIGAVLAAAEGDAVVDHHDLAMVAQVHPAECQMTQARHVVQRRQRVHAGFAQLPPAPGAREGARAQGIHHDAASHAASSGGRHRVGDLAAVAVVQPDVEADVHMLHSLPDIGRQRVDGGIGVFHQRKPVAGDRSEAVDRTAEIEQGHGPGSYRVGSEGDVVGQRHPRFDLAQAPDPLTANAGFAEKQIGDHAQQRQEHDDGHPGHARGGRAVGAGDRTCDHQQVHHEQRGGEEQAERVVQPVQR